ncbi:MAG: caspase family protein, partial [Desulfosarcinaceae bacterium]
MTRLPRRAAGIFSTGLCLFLPLVILLSLLPSDAGAGSRGISMEAAGLAGFPADGGTYRALLIGNDAYPADRGPWKPLKTAVAGARALKQVLLRQYGFSDVKVLENATRREILLALQALSRRIMQGDSVLMYYAGHGYLNMDTRRGYWVPVDAKDTDQTTFLRNSTIRDELGIIAARAKHTLLISDACFSGTLLRGDRRGISAQTGTEAYYRKVAKKKSIQVLTAGGVEYVDDDYHTSGHSPFTYFLLNELKNNDRLLLTASELSTNVEKAVANNVDQVPESGVVQGAGDELGEFIFINIDLAVPGVPKERVKVKVNVVDADTATSHNTRSDLSLDLGVELLAGGWSGKNNARDTDYDGGGGQLGLNLAFNKGRFFTSLD